LTTILFLPSNLTHTNSFQSHQQRKQQQHRIRFDSDLQSDSDSDYGGPISIPITAARSRLRRPDSAYGPDRSIEALNRFAIPDSDSRSRVSVPSNDQDSDYGGPIPFSVSGPIDLAIRVSLSKQSINTYQSSAPKHRIVFLTKHDLYVQISLSKQSPCTVSAKETPSSRSAVPFFFSLLP